MKPCLAALAAVAATAPTAASVGLQPPAAAAEAPAAVKMIEGLAVELGENFVFPEIGARYAAMLRANAAAQTYRGLEGETLAERLTADLQAVHADRHLRVFPPGNAGPGLQSAGGPPKIEPIVRSGWVADGVAYIDFTLFPGDPETVAAVERFLDAHENAKALIIDVRGNRGGGLAEMDAMFARLFAERTELVRMDTRRAVEEQHGSPVGALTSLRVIEAPETIVRRAHYALPTAKRSPLSGVPVYLLTSGFTASAAEHFALSLKRTGRATLVGETTRGAGHYGGRAGLPGGWSAFIPVGRTWDPDTGEGWEGVGVAPHVVVPASGALDEALRRIGIDPAAPRLLETRRRISRRPPTRRCRRRRSRR